MFKPMLAGKITDPNELTYPLLASPKLDGIRCLIINGVPVSRNMKPIPNWMVQDILKKLPPMDGELIVGPPSGQDVFQRTSSGVMSRDGEPQFTFWVFDVMVNSPMPFNQRYEMMKSWASSAGKNVKPVIHKLIKTPEALADYEAQMLLAGYEGVMTRHLDGMYKNGRSTEREQWLLKLKRFEDSEAEVLGYEEKQHNENTLQEDELGRAKRSSHKAGKRAAGVLGALSVRDVHTGVEFSVGAGFSDEQRASVWAGRSENLIGRTIKYRYQPTGVKDKPRFPVFLGFRHEDDA